MNDVNFTALSAASLAMSSAALMAAEEAKARAILASFNPATASDDDKQNYAKAVFLIYGDGNELLWYERMLIKASIVWVFMCTIGGMIKSIFHIFNNFTYAYKFDTFWDKIWFSVNHVDVVLGMLGGFLFGMVSTMLAGLIVVSIWFLRKG